MLRGCDAPRVAVHYAERRSRAHRHVHALDCVVAESGYIRDRLFGLDTAIRIGGAAGEHVLARPGCPVDRPAAPGPGTGRRVERRIPPLPIDRDFDTPDLCAIPRPCAPG